MEAARAAGVSFGSGCAAESPGSKTEDDRFIRVPSA